MINISGMSIINFNAGLPDLLQKIDECKIHELRRVAAHIRNYVYLVAFLHMRCCFIAGSANLISRRSIIFTTINVVSFDIRS